MSQFKLDGKKIIELEREVPMLTAGEIKAHLAKMKLVSEGRRVVIKEGSEGRLLDRMPDNYRLGANAEGKSIPGGTIKGGPSRRELFIKTQVASVAEVLGERHGQAVQLDVNLRFVLIPCFFLPRRWGTRTTPILIWFPDQYPDIPPHGFYLSQRCHGPHILRYNVYGDSPDLSDWGWNWYCVNPKGWRAHADPMEPDNLWTFLEVVRTSLTEDEY